MKILLLITHAYPFAPPSEQFLHSELEYLSHEFDKVFLFPTSRSALTKDFRKCGKNVITRRLKRQNKIKEGVEQLVKHALTSFDFYRDLINLLKSKAFSRSEIKQFINFHTNGLYIANAICNEIETIGIDADDEITLYSYWLQEHAYAAVLIKEYLFNKGIRNTIAISRAHGSYDVFCTKNGFRPCIKHLNKGLDRIFSVSEKGARELVNQGFNKAQVSIQCLGVLDYGVPNERTDSSIIIASCSSVIKIKRVHLIVEALAMIRDIDITWEHFGDGDQLDSVKSKAQTVLPENIKYVFYGYTPNESIQKQYIDNCPNIFLNVSEIEGIPVSIMEAISFGIPIIATDVGGTNEICIDGYNGYLLPADPRPREIAETIKQVLKEYDMELLSKNSRELFESKYNSEKNYTEFARMISSRSFDTIMTLE